MSDLSPNRTLIVDLPGPDLTPDQGRFLRQHGFGGVCLFARNITAPERTVRLIRDLRDALGHDALVATDQEGGAVLRRLDVPLPPTPQALGVIGSEAAAHEAGAVAARGLIELGINWNFAPSLDVNSNPRNPVIGERSFSADPAEVARLGVAWALGSEAAGVMASVKHFPGHGDTAQDSHLTLPTVNKPRAELEATEWLPFRAAVQAGVGSVMTAHILYPALDPARPATLSPAALTGLLRQDWGYDGVVVTDATDMRAIADHYPRGSAAPAALAAGADAVLSCGHGSLALHAQNAAALAEALAAGTLSAERLAEAQARLARAALRFSGMPRPYPPAQHGADQQAVQDWAARSLRWQGTPPALDPAGPVLLVAPESAALGGPYGDFLGGAALAASLRGMFPHLQVALHGGHDSGAAEALLAQFPGTPVLLATTGRWGVSAAEARLAAGLRQSRRPALHLALWSPETVEALGLPAIVTHGFRPTNLRALGAALATLRLHAPH